MGEAGSPGRCMFPGWHGGAPQHIVLSTPPPRWYSLPGQPRAGRVLGDPTHLGMHGGPTTLSAFAHESPVEASAGITKELRHWLHHATP